MSKYSDLVSSFLDDYERPTVDEYIVGFSGLDPDRKIKPEEIDHESLGGLIGGEVAGHYHITREQLQKLKAYEGQITALQASLAAKIKEAQEALDEAERVLGARITSTENTQAALTEKQNTLIGNVSGLQSTARDLGIRMTGAENAQEALTASQRTLTAATEYIDAEEKKLATRMKTAETRQGELEDGHDLLSGRIDALDSARRELSARVAETEAGQDTLTVGQRTLSGRVDALDSAEKSLATRVTATENGQSELKSKQASMTVRLDTIENEATTDTEILDARVDANDIAHITLGENLRSLHSVVLEEAAHERRDRAEVEERITEESSYVGEAVIRTGQILHEEIANRKAADESILADLSAEMTQRQKADTTLGTRIDGIQSGLSEEAASRRSADQTLTAKTTELERKITAEETARQSKDAEISGNVEELSTGLASEITTRKTKDSEIQAELNRAQVSIAETITQLASEVTARKAGDARLSESIEAETVAREDADEEISELLEEEISDRIETDKASHEEARAIYDYAREQTDLNAQTILGEILRRKEGEAQTARENQHVEAGSLERDEYMREQIDDVSEAALSASLAIASEAERRREGDKVISDLLQSEAQEREAENDSLTEDISLTREQINATHKYLSEGLGELSGAMLEHELRQKRLKEDIAHDVSRNETEHERLREDTAANAEGIASLAGVLADYAAKRKSEHDHEIAHQEDQNAQSRNDISDLASGVIEVADTVARSTHNIRNALEHEQITREAETGRLQEDVQQLAAGLTQNTATIWGIRSENTHEREMLREDIDDLRQQSDENAQANLNNAYTELRTLLDRLRVKAEIMNAIEAARKKAELIAEKHDEAEADLAAAAIENTRLIHDVAEKHRATREADLSHVERLYSGASEHVREQVDTLVGAFLSDVVATHERLSSIEATLTKLKYFISANFNGSADDDEIEASIDDIFAGSTTITNNGEDVVLDGIDEIFAGNMAVSSSGDEEFDSMIDQIFNTGVNP